MNDHNLMGEVVAKAERGRDEYTRMQEDMAALQTAHDQLQLESNLLRAAKLDVELRNNLLQDERDYYMRFAVEMSSQLAMLDHLQDAHSTAMSIALQRAVEASKLIAAAKPKTNELREAETDKHVVSVNEAVDRIKGMAAGRGTDDDALASVASALGQATGITKAELGDIIEPAQQRKATRR